MNASRLALLAKKAYQRFGEDNCSQMAAAIAYYVLFAIVPLTIFLVSVASTAVPDEARADVTEWVEGYLNVSPDDVTITMMNDSMAGIEEHYGTAALDEIGRELADINESDERSDERDQLADTIGAGDAISVAGYELAADEVDVRSASFVSEIIEQAADAAVPLGIVGFVALAFSASIAFSAIRRSLNVVWSVPQGPFAQQRLIELAMLVGLAVLLGASVAGTTAAQIIREQADGARNPVSAVDGISWLAFGYVVPWAFTFVLVLLAYRYVPNATQSLADVWPGALFASAGIEILKYGYSVYVANFANYGAAYGALGGILLFMFFVWTSSYIFLMGAEVAAVYPKLMRGDYATESEPGPRRSLWERAWRELRGLFVAKGD
ncbi:MAG: YihY/virulence factor BrkB family protein [Dehalococcoidia bacterium]